MLSIVLLLALAAADEDVAGAQVTSVLVEGGKDEAAKESALGVFGVSAGDAFDAARVRLGIKRVFLTGPWADVRVSVERGDGGVVVFLTLVPDVLVAEVELKVPPGLPKERLEEAAGIDAGERFRPERIDEAAGRMRAAMADLGYPRADVVVDVLEAGDDARQIRFVVQPGTPVRLRELVVAGNPQLSRREIEDLLGIVEGQAFDRPRLEVGLERVRALLLRRRHLGVKVGVVSVTHDEGKASARVVVTIDAGPRYRLRYVGNHVLSDAALRTVLNEGKIENVDALGVARAKAALENAYRASGYAQVKVAVDDAPAARPNLDDAERELRFFIEEGPRAEVTDVVVEGAQAHPASELVKEVWSTVNAEAPDSGLLQAIDAGDVDDLLSQPTGKERAEPRPFEISDERFELLPRPFIGRKAVYVENAFVEAGRRLADLYRSDGFLDASVKGPFPEFSDDHMRIRVKYVVVEGPRVTVSAVRFIDARPCAVDASCAQQIKFSEILDAVKLAPGQPASIAVIGDARSILEKNLKDRGHPFARVTESIERLATAPEVDIVYTVDPGARVTVGKVRVRGNKVTRELVILDRVTLEPGDVYSESEVETSRGRLARLGLFTSVSIELLDDDPRATVRDLLVLVKERPQFAVEVGAGASVEDGPRAFLGGEIRNIFGLGFGLRGRGQLNYPRAFYEFLYDENDPNPLGRFEPVGKFCEDNGIYGGAACDFVVDWGRFLEGQAVLTAELPKVYGMPFDTRFHVDTVALREIRPAFTLNRASLLVGFDLQPARWLTVGPQVEGEFSDFDCPKDLLKFGQSCGAGSIGLTRRTDAGGIRQTTYRMAGSVDLRDNPVHPREGLWLSGATDLALGKGELRLGSDKDQTNAVNSDFVKITGAAAGYVPLSPSFVWALSGRFGNIFAFGTAPPLCETSDDGPYEYVPLFKRFYLGGTSSIRGFHEDEILPADNAGWPASSQKPVKVCEKKAVLAPQSLGGTFFVSGRSEVRVNVIGDVELGTFVDVGQLLEDVRAFDVGGFAAGAGVGLRYNTPVGPFAIDLGWKVVDGKRVLPQLSSLERMTLHLSIGYF